MTESSVLGGCEIRAWSFRSRQLVETKRVIEVEVVAEGRRKTHGKTVFGLIGHMGKRPLLMFIFGVGIDICGLHHVRTVEHFRRLPLIL